MKDRVSLFKEVDDASAHKYKCIVNVGGVEYEAALFTNVTRNELIWWGGTLKVKDNMKGEEND